MKKRDVFPVLISSIDEDIKYYRDRIKWIIHYTLLMFVVIVYAFMNKDNLMII